MGDEPRPMTIETSTGARVETRMTSDDGGWTWTNPDPIDIPAVPNGESLTFSYSFDVDTAALTRSKDCGKTAADLERTEMPSDQTLSDLAWKLPRLDSNQQPFGEQPPYDGVRPQPHYQGKHHFPFDHSRPESTGFNCGKTAADHGRRYNALGWPAYLGAFLSLVLVAVVVAGIVWGLS